MTKLSDLFVNEPIKKEPVDDAVEIDGSFSCQNCGEQADTAKMAKGKIYWTCTECGHASAVNGLG